MFELKKASRKKTKMRVGLFGPSGSGKTMSALRFARGLTGSWESIAVIDTEQGSADLYSQLGDYKTLTLNKFDPSAYIDAIKYVETFPDIECLIIDSISHEWEGPGGCLAIHARMGGRFETWAKVTPMHQAFIDAITHSPLHIIATGRAKIDYDMSKDEKTGKAKIEKMGLKTITREGFDYEMTLAFKINQQHFATTDKDRTGLFNTEVPFLITEDVGLKLKSWNEEVATPYEDVMSYIRYITDNYKDRVILQKIIDVHGGKEKIRGLSFEEQKELLENLKDGSYLTHEDGH